MSRGATVPKALSPKHSKFRELAQSRTNRALEAIARIGNLSNKHLYEWDELEIRKVIKALRSAVSDVETRFTSPKEKLDAKFRF